MEEGPDMRVFGMNFGVNKPQLSPLEQAMANLQQQKQIGDRGPLGGGTSYIEQAQADVNRLQNSNGFIPFPMRKPQENQERFVPAPIKENLGQSGTNQPILGLPGNPYPKQQGPLTPQSSSPAMTSDFLSQPNQSDKKRDRTSFGDYLMQKQNVGPGQQTLGTKLVRMGAAMQGASPQGLNAAMAAMGNEYGNIQNEGIAADLANLAAQSQGQEEGDNGLEETTQMVDKLQSALTRFDDFSSVTGFWDKYIVSNLDASGVPGFSNADREAFRIQLRDIIVDQTLLNTANTKGAISDKEMALFQSSVPTMSMDEDVWKSWLKARIENLKQVQTRLNNGVVVGRNAGVGFSNTYTASQSEPSTSQFSPEDQALIDQYSK